MLAGRLYPCSWRKRYGEEFDALLEDVPATAKQALDIAFQAMRMQLADKHPYLLFLSGLVIAGGLAGLAVPYALPKKPVSSAIVQASAAQFLPLPVPSGELALESNDRLRAIRSRLTEDSTLAAIVQSQRLYSKESKTHPFSDVIDLMRGDLTIEVLRHKAPGKEFNQALEISFAYADPPRARAAVNALVAEAAKANNEANDQRRQTWRSHFGPAGPDAPPIDLSVLREAAPAFPPSPRAWVRAVVEIECGLGLALLACALVRWPRPMLRVTAFASAGCALAVCIGYFTLSEYTSTAALVLKAPVIPGRERGIQPHYILLSLSADATAEEELARIAATPTLPFHVKPLQQATAELKRHLSLTMLGPPDAAANSGLVVTATNSDPVVAQRLVEETVSHMMASFQREQRALCASESQAQGDRQTDQNPPVPMPFLGAIPKDCDIQRQEFGFRLNVLNQASLPEDAGFPALMLAVAGAVFGLLVLAFIDRRKLTGALQGAMRLNSVPPSPRPSTH
jgi:hypothetical protein